MTSIGGLPALVRNVVDLIRAGRGLVKTAIDRVNHLISMGGRRGPRGEKILDPALKVEKIRAFYVNSSTGTRKAAEDAGDEVIQLTEEAFQAVLRKDQSLARGESVNWARTASGKVNVYLPELGGTGSSIFWKDEFPALVSNSLVDEINFIIVLRRNGL